MQISKSLVVLALATLPAATALAQAWPSRTVHVLVGFNAGTSIDIAARITSAEIGKRLGQNFVVENRPGAAGHIARTAVARAEPDGYLILLDGLPTGSHPLLRQADPLVVGRDLSPLSAVATSGYAFIVRSGLGVKTFQELVDYAKRNPTKLNYGSVSLQVDLIAESIKAKSGLSYTPISYKGAPIAELLRGDVDLYVGALSGLAEHIKSGKLVPLLATAKFADYPNLPTAVDMGLLEQPLRSLLGYYGRSTLPREVVQRFAQAALAASKAPQVLEGLRKLDWEPIYLDPEQQQKAYDFTLSVLGEAARLTKFKPQ